MKPCATRAAIRKRRVAGASAQANEARVKPAAPITKRFFRPNLSPSRPPTTRATAKARVYAPTTHCTVLAAAAEVALDRGGGEVDDRRVEQVHDLGGTG